MRDIALGQPAAVDTAEGVFVAHPVIVVHALFGKDTVDLGGLDNLFALVVGPGGREWHDGLAAKQARHTRRVCERFILHQHGNRRFRKGVQFIHHGGHQHGKMPVVAGFAANADSGFVRKKAQRFNKRIVYVVRKHSQGLKFFCRCRFFAFQSENHQY